MVTKGTFLFALICLAPIYVWTHTWAAPDLSPIQSQIEDAVQNYEALGVRSAELKHFDRKLVKITQVGQAPGLPGTKLFTVFYSLHGNGHNGTVQTLNSYQIRMDSDGKIDPRTGVFDIDEHIRAGWRIGDGALPAGLTSPRNAELRQAAFDAAMEQISKNLGNHVGTVSVDSLETDNTLGELRTYLVQYQNLDIYKNDRWSSMWSYVIKVRVSDAKVVSIQNGSL